MRKVKIADKEFDGEINPNNIEVRSGVYFLYSEGQLMYIGKTNNLTKRIITHMEEGTKKFDTVKFNVVPFENLSRVESVLIKTLKPPLNATNKDLIEYSDNSRRSTITIRQCIHKHHRKKDGTYNVKIRVSYRKKSFYIKTNIFVYDEDIENNHVKNVEIVKNIRVIEAKLRNVAKYISSDKTYEFVKNKLLSITI